MASGLKIRIVETDADCLGIEIQASSDRFAGSAWVYAGLKELSELAAELAGFPASADDERTHEFGSREPSRAGGYVSLRFRCLDAAGHASIDISIEDDDQRFDAESARLSVPVQAAAIDRFTQALRTIESARSGEAQIPSAT
jgi:hypothetical protein